MSDVNATRLPFFWDFFFLPYVGEGADHALTRGDR